MSQNRGQTLISSFSCIKHPCGGARLCQSNPDKTSHWKPSDQKLHHGIALAVMVAGAFHLWGSHGTVSSTAAGAQIPVSQRAFGECLVLVAALSTPDQPCTIALVLLLTAQLRSLATVEFLWISNSFLDISFYLNSLECISLFAVRNPLLMP